MRFFDWFKKQKIEETELTSIPVSTVIRWCLYDMSISETNEIAVAMGLSPVSEEGHEKEVQDSNERLANIYELLPFVEMMSDISSKICTASQLRELESVVDLEALELTPESIESLVAAQKAVAFAAIVSVLSSGIELGILHPNTDHIHSWKQEQYDE